MSRTSRQAQTILRLHRELELCKKPDETCDDVEALKLLVAALTLERNGLRERNDQHQRAFKILHEMLLSCR